MGGKGGGGGGGFGILLLFLLLGNVVLAALDLSQGSPLGVFLVVCSIGFLQHKKKGAFEARRLETALNSTGSENEEVVVVVEVARTKVSAVRKVPLPLFLPPCLVGKERT